MLPRMVPTRARSARHVARGAEPGEMERAGDGLTDAESSSLIVELPIGVVLVDRRYHIHTINSAALHLLDIYRPAVGGDLVHLAERVPAQALRRLIDAVFQGGSSGEAALVEGSVVEAAPAGANQGRPREGPAVVREVVREVVTLETGLGERRDLEIAAYPHLPRRGGERRAAERADRADTALLLVTDVTRAVAAHSAAARAAARDQREPEGALQRHGEDVGRLTAQLERVTAINRQLLAANQELGSVNLELQRVNDELLLAQEQEQASAEEIRTLNEELQASTEELETVNEELEATVEELRSSNDDLVVSTREVQGLADAAERQHQASEAKAARLDAILLSLGDAVLVVDPAGAPLLTNKTYARLFGDASAPFAAQDAEGHPLLPEAMPQRRAARGEAFLMEFTLDGDDGTRRYFEANGQPIRSLGQALGGVISVRDITERSVYRLQDEFLALASHELRTPLTPLYVYLQLLDNLFADDPDHAQKVRGRDYITHALDQVRKLRRLLEDLLDVRRLQQGGFRLEVERVLLAQVLARSVEAARLMVPPGQIIDLEVAETAVVVTADAMRLEQVVMNLLTNAMTYAPHAPRIVVHVHRAGNEAVVRVQDAGPGMPAADLPHIFSRFYQVTSPDQRPFRRGLGLGLYIAHGLVAAHGGRLEVASAQAPGQGHGTTFTIRLPLAADAASGQSG